MRPFLPIPLWTLLLVLPSSCGNEANPRQTSTGPLTPAFAKFSAELYAPGQVPGSCFYTTTFSSALAINVEEKCTASDTGQPATQRNYTTFIAQAVKNQVDKNLEALRTVAVAARYLSDEEIADNGGYTITFTRVDGTTFSTFVETGSESKLPPPLAELYGLLRDGVIHR